MTAERAWGTAEGGGEGAEASGLPGAGGVRRWAGLRSWAGPREVSDPRARTALPGPDGAGPGCGAWTGRGIRGQGWPELRVGAQGCGFQASSRQEFCLPSDSDEQTRAERSKSVQPHREIKFTLLPPHGHLLVSLPPGPQGGHEGEGTFLLIKEVSGLGETRGYPALSVNSAIIPVRLSEVPSTSSQGGTHFLFTGSRGSVCLCPGFIPCHAGDAATFPQTAGSPPVTSGPRVAHLLRGQGRTLGPQGPLSQARLRVPDAENLGQEFRRRQARKAWPFRLSQCNLACATP